jgi:hypothetical protein
MMGMATKVSEVLTASIFTSTLKMEAGISSETLVTIYDITRRQNAQNHNPKIHCRENLKYQVEGNFFTTHIS